MKLLSIGTIIIERLFQARIIGYDHIPKVKNHNNVWVTRYVVKSLNTGTVYYYTPDAGINSLSLK